MPKSKVSGLTSQVKMQLLSMASTNKTFTYYMSNYSAKFIDANGNVIKKILGGKRSNKMFAAANKIKSDIKKSDFVIPEFHKEIVQYYSYNKKYLSQPNFEVDRVINIDLRNAYATVLSKSGIITERTYNFLLTLEKVDRLIAVGMLAYEPEIFEYVKGVFKSYEKQKNEYSIYFFYCIHEVFNIMSKCRKLLGDDFIFSWVDGFYFIPRSQKKIDDVINYLNSIDYNYSCDELTGFKSVFLDSHANITYHKKKSKKEINISLEDKCELVINTLHIKRIIYNNYS